MSSFIKKVLIDQGEFDRLQQRQIREYSPELQSMAELRNHITDVLDNKSLSTEEKLNLFGTYQSRFTKLKKDTGVLSSSVPAIEEKEVHAAPVAPVAAPNAPVAAAVPNAPPNVPAPVAPPNAPAPAPVPNAPMAAAADPGGEQEEPMAIAVRNMGVQPMYENKARRLLHKIRLNPGVLNHNEAGEIVVNGNPIHGSSFNAIFSSMVTANPDLHQPGLDQFLGALHTMGVKEEELSAKSLKSKFTRTAHAAKAAHEPQMVPKPDAPDAPKKAEKQEGRGIKRKSPSPPGTRPKILYVY